MTIRAYVPTLTNVASSATSVTLFAASQAAQRYVYNDSTAVLYITLGSSVASATNYTFQLAAGGSTSFSYNGPVTAIWASANGSARCTELS